MIDNIGIIIYNKIDCISDINDDDLCLNRLPWISKLAQHFINVMFNPEDKKILTIAITPLNVTNVCRISTDQVF